MQTALVMTILGRDRPGLVDAVARVIRAYEGNWLESRMSHLGGHFAGILRVTVPAEEESALRDALGALSAEGLSVVVHVDETTPPAESRATTVLELVGQDRPGIVHQITHALAAHGANVEELQSEVCSAAMSGEILFKARIAISLPPGCDVAALQRELEKIAADLIVDVTFANGGETKRAANP